MYNKKKKKSMNLLSRQFYIDNQGDIFCCILMLIMGSQMISFTKHVGSFFVKLNHEYNPQNITHALFDRTYHYGYYDSCTLITILFFWLTFLSVLEEYITDKFIPRLKLSLTSAYELRVSVFGVTFAFYYIFHYIYYFYHIINKNNILFDIFNNKNNVFGIFNMDFVNNLLNNFVKCISNIIFMVFDKSKDIINFHTKLLIFLTLMFNIASIVKLYVSKTAAKNGNNYVKEWLLQFSILVLMIQLKFNEFATFCFFIRAIHIFFDSMLIILAALFKRITLNCKRLRFGISFGIFAMFVMITCVFVKIHLGNLVDLKKFRYLLCVLLMVLCDLYYAYNTMVSFSSIPNSTPTSSVKLKQEKPVAVQATKPNKQKVK